MTDISNNRASRLVDVSIVIPIYNEQDNVVELIRELRAMIDAQTLCYEAILVDDGSADLTIERARQAIGDDPRFSLIEFMKNFGQTAAMAAGINQSQGEIIVPMDGDLQNDPADIPSLVVKLDEAPGWDIVSGWRKNRQDKLLSRRFPSIIANRLIKKLTWTTEIHDFGCSLKAYRRVVLEDVRLYGEMHRFLPAVCRWRGARITEQVVHHRPRVAGQSKYGLKRTFKVMLDLLTMKFLGDYLSKPIYFFGKLAMGALLISLFGLIFAICQKFGYFYGGSEESLNLNRNVLVLFSMMIFLMSVMFLMLGIMSELLVRIYHESQDKMPYKIRHIYKGGQTKQTSDKTPQQEASL